MKQLTLITNLRFVKPHSSEIRLYVYALLIEQEAGKEGGFFDGPTRKIRGFLSDGSLPVFDQFLSNDPLPLKFASAKSEAVFIGDNGVARPLSTGAVLELAGGEKFSLYAQNGRRDIDVSKYEDYDKLWDALPRKVAEYWDAPNMPLPRWESAEFVRQMLASATGVIR